MYNYEIAFETKKRLASTVTCGQRFVAVSLRHTAVLATVGWYLIVSSWNASLERCSKALGFKSATRALGAMVCQVGPDLLPIHQYELCRAHADQIANRELAKGRQIIHREVK